MDYQRNLRYIRAIFLQCMVLFIVKTVIEPVYCDDVTENAINQTNESSINVTLQQQLRLGSPVLSVTCQGTNYTCTDVPKYEIQQNEIYVLMSFCAPSVLECLSQVYEPPMVIKYLEVHDMIGQGSDEDWSSMKSVSGVRFHLKDSDMLPNEAINYLPSLSDLYIEAGNFTLPLKYHVTNKDSLKRLELNRNGLNKLPANAFEGLSNLTSLDISNIHFEVMNVQAFVDLIKLEDLELKNNIIDSIEPATTFSDENRQLKTYKLYNNSMAFLPNDFFRGFLFLDKILLQDNQIEMKLDATVFSHLSPSINLLQVTNCKIRELPEFVLQSSSNLHNLNMNDNLIEKLHPNLFSNTFSMRSISLAGNKIDRLPDLVFSKMKKLEILDLSRNCIEKLSGNIFQSNSKLSKLNLNDNNIKDLDRGLFDEKVFLSVSLAANKLQNIEALSYKIASLPSGRPSWETKELNLSLNQLEAFADWLTEMKKIEYLDLSSNKIKMLSSNFIERRENKLTINLRNNTISHIIGNPSPNYDDKYAEENILLYLSNNPFECDCLTTSILHDWNRRKIIGDFEDLICENGVKVSTINAYLQCNENHALIGLIGTCLLGTLIGFIVLISILTRWNQIWRFITKYVLNRRTSDSMTYELSQDALKPYDLFISFAHQDEEFVTEHLLPKLEFEYGLKVCVHYRDWVVGQLIPDQIILSVENARMTVIILTENFLQSDWSYLEFRTAHNLGLQEGKPRVVLILLNESIVRDERLNTELKSYIAINSYVVWRDPYFWSKLEKRLTRSGHQLNMYE